jgi:hypothetical protein
MFKISGFYTLKNTNFCVNDRDLLSFFQMAAEMQIILVFFLTVNRFNIFLEKLCYFTYAEITARALIF